ncbi:uncharacterized protein LOC112048372 [Bicyclus anynana]|uniref:Uncharacterized protein LOC112048372 n=1 Tax=Bicyclus anynana TaxID=110368 RepID=A0ABM3M4M7_BICAN|nr:uncharacterized protein LOC112048372 [Bicyclus anynana]
MELVLRSRLALGILNRLASDSGYNPATNRSLKRNRNYDEDDDSSRIKFRKTSISGDVFRTEICDGAKTRQNISSTSNHWLKYNNVEDNGNNVSYNVDDEVLFVKEISKSPISKNNVYKNEGRDELQYYILGRNINKREASYTPRKYIKLQGPIGIVKSYKKTPKKCFKQLKITDMGFNTVKPKKYFKQLKITDMGFNTVKHNNDLTKEYDPITVASKCLSDSEVNFVPLEKSTSFTKVDRVNTLRDNQKDIPVVSMDWLSQLNTKYIIKNNHTQAKMLDLMRESDINSKVISDLRVAFLENMSKYELSSPYSLIVEPKPTDSVLHVPKHNDTTTEYPKPTVELPPLTLAQEELVKKAFGPGPAGQLLVEKFNLKIFRRDLQTLAGQNWLNDEVINFYMNLLIQRSETREDLPKVYATNTFFYPKLMQSGHAGLKRWTRKVDIFEHDLMLVPVHLGKHWCLSLIDFREKKISYLDSLGHRNQACLDALLKYLYDEHKDKKGQTFDSSEWVTENLKDIPQQLNGSDCGIFACTFAEFSARGAEYSFTQAQMPYLRRKAALEILQARLLL